MNSSYSESERRLRAIVRAFVSPAVWLVVTVQLIIAALRWFPLPQTASGPPLRVLATAGLLFLLFFAATGCFRALAQTRDVVSFRHIFGAGREVFAPFLWLVVKAGILFLAVAFALTSFLAVASSDRAESVAATILFVTVVSGVLGFAFVYWLPWVFVRQDFRLMATLYAALQIFWERRAQSVFVAILTLGPTAVAAVLPNETPLPVALIFSWFSLFAAWIAFIYCAEWLQEHRAPTT